ncbi:MAG TPA: MinD/ParA family protein [Parvibaculum sp.]|uniref:MinD/ParA family protein n=1 Tax=Parvibaculum sp. TaxID=2024848 RepID=UPI002D17308A|nr:MinD/ParA family protein [Parvibaculum sp.]HMM14201.1 MinD/ParA family protein [Parvibaculum sp.]
MSHPRMIQIASGKGGVGKTWFAITLAEALAGMNRDVLLFDGDLGLANVDVQLGLSPKHDLGSVIAGRVRIEDAITTYEIPSVSGAAGGLKFDVLAGKSGSGVLSALTRPEIAAIARNLVALSARYAHVVIDLAAGLDQSVLALCTPGSTTLVIVTDEPTSLTDAYAFIKLLTLQEPQADIRIVVNFANDREHAWRTHAALSNACRNFLGFNPPLAGFVPRDDLVRDAIRRQTPLLFRHPQAKASEAVRRIARDLLLPLPAQEPVKTARGHD